MNKLKLSLEIKSKMEDELEIQYLPVKYHQNVISLIEELQLVIVEAQKFWLGRDKFPATLGLLDKLGIDLLLVKRFVAEDNFEAVKLSWDVPSINLDNFAKAFFYQKPLLTTATELRQKIITEILEVLKRKANVVHDSLPDIVD